MFNGLVFYLSGWASGESFQTERGMRIALKRAGFVNVRFRRGRLGRPWRAWFVEAEKRCLGSGLRAISAPEKRDAVDVVEVP